MTHYTSRDYSQYSEESLSNRKTLSDPAEPRQENE